uniref:Uncharacterized protein n=1 Tax=Syphacia muris TaxID=451379 RepID=A0A0N5ABD6_9BILA
MSFVHGIASCGFFCAVSPFPVINVEKCCFLRISGLC